MRRAANWFALAWTILVGGFFLFGPVYGTTTSATAISPAGPVGAPMRSGAAGLAAATGLWAYVVLALPALLAAVPLLVSPARPRRRLNLAFAAFLGLFALVGAASIGLFYVPVAIALIVAAVAEPRVAAAA